MSALSRTEKIRPGKRARARKTGPVLVPALRRARRPAAGPRHPPRRVEHLYEISKLFANFENIDQTLDPALGIVALSFPLRSAILIESEGSRSRMIVWSSEGQSTEQLRAVKEHVAAAYSYLVGATSTESLVLNEQAGRTALPRPVEGREKSARRFIVLPLAVARRPPFGTLQLEGARALHKTDLMFVNAIANQLAVALDRDRAWRQDIARREDAEEGRTDAEVKSVAAERERALAEALREQSEALAADNSRLYERAQQAVRVREQVLAIVSHDLRNPLGTILLTTAGLTKKAPAEERRRGLAQSIQRIHRSAERMLRLIEDLLDFANIEAGHLAIERQTHDPASMIHETIAHFEGVAREKQLRLTADVEDSLPKVYCDRDRILQVFSNVVGNATKVTAEGGHVTLRAEARGHEILFSVADSGPGIPANDVKHLFERYWRGGQSQYKGTGLGLAIACGIVVAHGGRIWAESELGRGATFLFTIPTPEAKAAAADDPAGPWGVPAVDA
jgi:signal transduction histidine kinase